MNNINLPKVMLLYAKYPWIDAGEWKQCLPKLSYIDNFHTVFLVSDQSSNSILHTIESTWLN